MSKLKKFFPLLMAVTLICMGFFPVQSIAKDSTINKEKEIQALANELEYIFSTILVKDKLTGVYLVNEEALKNSHYNAEEQAMFLEYAQQFKEQGDYGTNNTFDRCMQDLLGISQVVWNEIKGLSMQNNTLQQQRLFYWLQRLLLIQ
ncbi:hypothetical protein ACFQ38_14005 [Sporosarcina contaminans]|uniref:Uncharacterized protein n=1 Tax=Sporosarcina contaminans TaxID=633403 RepID=A0ABW3U3J5_9BACL